MAARPLHEMSDLDRDSDVDVASFLRDIEASEAPQEEETDLLSGYIMPDTPLDAEGPPVADKVKQPVDKNWDSPMTRVQAKELYGVLRRPENLPNLKRTLLNQELQKSLRICCPPPSGSARGTERETGLVPTRSGKIDNPDPLTSGTGRQSGQ